MYKPSENNKFGFESTEENYDDKGKRRHTLSLSEYYRIFDEYERALRNLERLMKAVESLDARLEALEKSEIVKTAASNVYIPAADGWRDLFRVRPGFYEWVEGETFEGGRFKTFRADTNGNGDAWRDAELKPVSPPLRWRPLPTPEKALNDE